MKKNLAALFFVIIFLIGFQTASAHTIDITLTDFDFEEDAFTVRSTTTINWLQVTSILELTSIQDLAEFAPADGADKLADYFLPRIRLQQNGVSCTSSYVEANWGDTEDLALNGAHISLQFDCPGEGDIYTVENTVLFETYATQTNFLTWTAAGEEDPWWQQITTPTVPELSLNVTELRQQVNLEGAQLEFEQKDGALSGAIEQVPELLKSGIWGLMLVLFIAVGIGALHTLEAGHSKTILAGLMINNRLSMKQGMVFAAVFTLSHMSDILIVATLLVLFDSFGDLYEHLSDIQRFAGYALLFISTAMLFQALYGLLPRWLGKKTEHHHNHKHDHEEGHDHHHEQNHNHHHGHHHHFQSNAHLGQQLTIAFMAGLAPCLMGWSLLLLVIAAGETWLIYPVVLAFGIGILLVEMLFVIWIKRLSDLLGNRLDTFALYSPLISAIILFVAALFWTL